jgi:hypothetical protein
MLDKLEEDASDPSSETGERRSEEVGDEDSSLEEQRMKVVSTDGGGNFRRDSSGSALISKLGWLIKTRLELALIISGMVLTHNG